MTLPSIPARCRLWQKHPLQARDLAPGNFTVLRTYLDESHLIRRLLRCNECGQLYFYELYEQIDWQKGNDPQYRTYIPLSAEEDAEILNASRPADLLKITPRIQSDWPSAAPTPKVKWIGR